MTPEHSDLFFNFIGWVNNSHSQPSRSFVSDWPSTFAKTMNETFGTSYKPSDLREDFFARL